MSKILKRGLFLIAAMCCFSSNAIASENRLSPIDFILSEEGVSKAEIYKNGTRNYLPHIGYETVILPIKNSVKIRIHTKNINNFKTIDDVHLDLGQNKTHCEELEKKLTAKYGAPKSQRNNIRIWELNNPDFTVGQSRKITIMAGEENGQYFLTVDRKGPRTGNTSRTNAVLDRFNQNGFNRINSYTTSPKVD